MTISIAVCETISKKAHKQIHKMGNRQDLQMNGGVIKPATEHYPRHTANCFIIFISFSKHSLWRFRPLSPTAARHRPSKTFIRWLVFMKFKSIAHEFCRQKQIIPPSNPQTGTNECARRFDERRKRPNHSGTTHSHTQHTYTPAHNTHTPIHTGRQCTSANIRLRSQP